MGLFRRGEPNHINNNVPLSSKEERGMTWGCGIPLLLGIVAGTLVGALTFNHAGLPYPDGVALEATRNAFFSGAFVTVATAFLGNRLANK
jgi:hypothetical protein